MESVHIIIRKPGMYHDMEPAYDAWRLSKQDADPRQETPICRERKKS